MKIVLIIIVSISIIILLGYVYLSGFKTLKIRTESLGGEIIVYKEIRGDYKQSGQVMDDVYYTLLNEHKLETFKGVGIYFDNPQDTPKDKLRSIAGCVIEKADYDRLKDIPSEYRTAELSEQECISTSFPYRGKLSVLLSIMKVYPALAKYATKNGLDPNAAVMEIYDIPNRQILYRKGQFEFAEGSVKSVADQAGM